MTSRQEVRFRQTFFQNEVKTVLHKTFLVSDVLAHTGRIYSPLNLENIKIQKLKFVLNTAPDNQIKKKIIQCTAWKLLNPLGTHMMQIFWIY